MKIQIAIPLMVALFVSGCNDTRTTSLTPTYLKFEPVIKISKNPGFTHWKHHTVFIADPSEVTKKQEYDNKIIESAMRMRLKSEFEALSYRVVDNVKHADLIAMIRGSNKYDTHYVPPSSVTLPKYIPGQTYTTNSQYSVYSGTGVTPRANVYGHSTTTTPGEWTTETHSRPGYTSGSYYPSIRVDVIDAATGDELYVATGTGTSHAADIRVASQVLILECFDQMPAGQASRIGSGTTGIRCQIATVDGNNYYPFVYQVIDGSPAHMAGMKFGDCIIKINGSETLNKTFNEYMKDLDGDPDTRVTLGILRNGQRVEKTIARKRWEDVYPKN